MAFADPLVVTIGGVAKNLPRVDSGRFSSEYLLTEATQEIRVLIRNQRSKADASGRSRDRHNISLRHTLFATATTPVQVRTCSASVEHYTFDDVTAYDDSAIAVAAMLTAANMVKLSNFES